MDSNEFKNYIIYYSRNGVPETGLTPEVVLYKKILDNSDGLNPPEISEIGMGLYKFECVPNVPMAVVVDSMDDTMVEADRYKIFRVTPLDSYIDEKISNVFAGVATVDGKVDNVAEQISSVNDNVLVVDGVVDDIKLKTDGLNFVGEDVKATLDGEKVTVESIDNNAITAESIKTEAVTKIQNGLATSTALSTTDGKVDAIKAKTDNLPSDPASNTQVNTRLASTSYTAPDNASISSIKSKTDNLPNDPASDTTVLTRLAAEDYAPFEPDPDIADIKQIVEKIQFTDDNDIKATLDDEYVVVETNLDKTGYELSQDARDNLKLDIIEVTEREGGMLDTVFDTVPEILTNTEDIKEVTDKVITLIELDPNDPGEYLWRLTKESMDEIKTIIERNGGHLDIIKTQTDKIKFNGENDVIATLDGEKVSVNHIDDDVITDAVIAEGAIKVDLEDIDITEQLTGMDEKIDGIKAKTDNLPNDPASDTNVLTRLAADDYVPFEPDPDVSVIKGVVEKIKFNNSNDVISTLDGENAVITNDQISDIKSGLATSDEIGELDEKIDNIQEVIIGGIPTVEEIVSGILSEAIDGTVDLQTALREILAVTVNNFEYENENNINKYSFKNRIGDETVITHEINDEGTERNIS